MIEARGGALGRWGGLLLLPWLVGTPRPLAAAEAGAAGGQPQPPPVEVAAPPAGRPRLVAAQAVRARALGREIRCPVCQGMPVGESPATMARDMQARLEGLVAEGRSDDEVRAWFVQRYGAWVLLDPPRRGMTLLLFVLPVTFGAVAAALAWRTWRRLSTGTAPAAAAGVALGRLHDEVER